MYDGFKICVLYFIFFLCFFVPRMTSYVRYGYRAEDLFKYLTVTWPSKKIRTVKYNRKGAEARKDLKVGDVVVSVIPVSHEEKFCARICRIEYERKKEKISRIEGVLLSGTSWRWSHTKGDVIPLDVCLIARATKKSKDDAEDPMDVHVDMARWIDITDGKDFENYVYMQKMLILKSIGENGSSSDLKNTNHAYVTDNYRVFCGLYFERILEERRRVSSTEPFFENSSSESNNEEIYMMITDKDEEDKEWQRRSIDTPLYRIQGNCVSAFDADFVLENSFYFNIMDMKITTTTPDYQSKMAVITNVVRGVSLRYRRCCYNIIARCFVPTEEKSKLTLTHTDSMKVSFVTENEFYSLLKAKSGLAVSAIVDAVEKDFRKRILEILVSSSCGDAGGAKGIRKGGKQQFYAAAKTFIDSDENFAKFTEGSKRNEKKLYLYKLVERGRDQ